ncbi:MAG: T9SS type A sorting domain-containing protein [Ignavibacteriae bacterium]|nr:T9SS type A sorting domain-containing protein [Ignavibacteriota bacterium]
MTYKRILFSVLLAVTLLGLTPVAQATHFRGGTLTWQQAGGNKIRFTFNVAYRRSFPLWSSVMPGGTFSDAGDRFYFGDGANVGLTFTATAVDLPNDIVFGTAVIEHIYPSTGNFIAYFTDCCRISTLRDGNNDANYRMETKVNVGSPFNNSPLISAPGIVNLAVGQTAATFSVAATDPDGNAVSYRLATTIESGLPTVSPVGLSLNGSTGQITFNTVGTTVGWTYALVVVAEDGTSKVMADFLIRIVGPSASPAFIAPTPTAGAIFTVTPPGNTVNFTVAASDPDAGSVVSLLPSSLPLGATFTPTLSGGSTASSDFSWTPSLGQPGTYLLTFVARDNVGVQVQRSFQVNVLCPLSVTLAGTTPVTCPGGSDGAIDVTVTNATAPVTYTWTGPGGYASSSLDISGLAAGTYDLTVRDANACVGTLQVVVVQDDAVDPQITAPSDVTVSTDADLCTTAGVNVVLGTPATSDNCTVSTVTNDAPSSFPIGATIVTWTVTDQDGNDATATQTVTVEDNQTPVITPASAATMWPPNHAYVSFSVADMITSIGDNCATLGAGDAVITSAWSDEAEDAQGGGDGNTVDDIVIAADCKSLQLRRERQGGGNGRVYTVNLAVSDGAGNTGTAQYQVKVPHNNNGTATDDGQNYTENSTCAISKAGRGIAELPAGYALEQNYPNPFNPTTTISFSIPADNAVRLAVYDMYGREVAVAAEGTFTAGMHRVTFDASALPSGSYIYALQAGSVLVQKTMQLVK